MHGANEKCIFLHQHVVRIFDNRISKRTLEVSLGARRSAGNTTNRRAEVWKNWLAVARHRSDLEKENERGQETGRRNI
jgi:hypothetical protein